MNVLKPSHTRRDPGPPELGPLDGPSCLGQFVLIPKNVELPPLLGWRGAAIAQSIRHPSCKRWVSLWKVNLQAPAQSGLLS